MKKREIGIVLGIVVVGLVALLFFNVFKKEADPNAIPTTQAKGKWVAIIHRQKVAQWFDSGVDGEYTVEGNYGEMVVEVKEGKWHVKEVECPNHTCENMGWDNGENLVPITCIPNDIIIATEDWAENYISNES